MIPPTVGLLFTSVTTVMNVQRLNRLRHWIFDMDGTLTVPSHDFPYMRRQLGMAEGDLDILAYVARHNEAEAAHMNQWLWDYEVDLAENAEPATGAADLVQHLHEQERKLAILTRNDKKLALITLQAIGLLDYFADDVIIGRDEAQPKPDPAGLQLILQHWQAASDDAIMVGDYVYDLQAGRNAGTHTLLLHPHNNLWPDLSDGYYRDCREIHQALQLHATSSPSLMHD